MADFGTFSTAAQAVSKATCPAFKNILVDMFVTGPSETAGIVTADNVEGRVIGWTPWGVDHGHQGLLLGLEIVGRLFGHLLSCIKQDQGSWVGPVRYSSHKGGVTLGIP
jgi:hypothetical protein